MMFDANRLHTRSVVANETGNMRHNACTKSTVHSSVVDERRLPVRTKIGYMPCALLTCGPVVPISVRDVPCQRQVTYKGWRRTRLANRRDSFLNGKGSKEK